MIDFDNYGFNLSCFDSVRRSIDGGRPGLCGGLPIISSVGVLSQFECCVMPFCGSFSACNFSLGLEPNRQILSSYLDLSYRCFG